MHFQLRLQFLRHRLRLHRLMLRQFQQFQQFLLRQHFQSLLPLQAQSQFQLCLQFLRHRLRLHCQRYQRRLQ